MPKSLTDLQVFNNIEANNTITSPQMIADDIRLNNNNVSLGSLHNDLQHSGVAEAEKSKWTLSYNATTRVFTVTLSSASYYYVNGKRFDLAAGAHNWPAHANADGTYFFYFDNIGNKTTSSGVWDILNTAQVATVKYNVANDGGSSAGLLMYELHGMVMPSAVHKYEHITEGTRLIQGGSISGFTIGTSSVGAITWSTTDSKIADEDIHTIIPPQPENNYLLGYFDAGLNFNWRTSATIPIFTNGTNIQYNQIGVGLTPITGNNVYVNYYVLLLPAVNPVQRTLIIPGQEIHDTLEEAQQESPANLNLRDLPFQEYVFLYQITFVRSAGGDIAAGKSAIAATPVRQGASRSTLVSSASDHNLLSNRNVFGAHLAGAIATNDASFTGILQPAIDISVQTALEKLSTRAVDRNIFNASGDLLYASADNTPAILSKGTDGQVLKLSSGLPSWGTDNNTTYSVGNGLTSAGTVFSMGTPSGLSATTTSATTSTSHTHAISTASAVALSNASTNTTGTSASLARADHTHSITGFSLDTHNHTGVYQPLDADLTSIAGLTGTTGFLKKTAANTWSLDTNSYLNLTGGTLTGTLTSRAITPSANNTYDLGTSSVKYKNGYFAGTLTADGGATIGGTLSVNNLTVNGTTTTVNSTTVTIDDPIFTLGGDTAPAGNDSKDRGIEYRWHNGTTAKLGFFGYDDSTGYFTFIPDATNTNEVFSGTKGTIDANLLGNVTGNASTATTLATARTISLTGVVTGSVSFNGNSDVSIATTHTADPTITLTGDVSGSGTMTNLGSVSITATVADDSHNHIISNVDGLQSALDGKQPTGSYLTTATTFGGDVSGTYNAIVVANDSHTHTASTLPSTMPPSAHTLDSHSNVTITSNTAGELLKWNGTAWVNNTLTEAGIQPAGSYLTTSSSFGGDVSGTYSNIIVADDSHNHIISNVDGLSDALAGKQPLDADLTSIAGLTGTTGLLKKTAANTWALDTTGYTTNTGTVTSVAMSVPTGLSVSGSPITTSGTLKVTLATGYAIPTTAKQANWDAAYTHAGTTHYAEPGIFSGGGTPTLATGVTGAEIRALIGAGTSSTTGTVTSIAAGNGMNFTTFSTTGTITMGKPSTLSASTNDATTSTSHTHAITATDSGSASTIVKTGSDGSVTAANTFKFGSNASMVYNSTSKTIDFVFV